MSERQRSLLEDAQAVSRGRSSTAFGRSDIRFEAASSEERLRAAGIPDILVDAVAVKHQTLFVDRSDLNKAVDRLLGSIADAFEIPEDLRSGLGLPAAAEPKEA